MLFAVLVVDLKSLLPIFVPNRIHPVILTVLIFLSSLYLSVIVPVHPRPIWLAVFVGYLVTSLAVRVPSPAWTMSFVIPILLLGAFLPIIVVTLRS